MKELRQVIRGWDSNMLGRTLMSATTVTSLDAPMILQAAAGAREL